MYSLCLIMYPNLKSHFQLLSFLTFYMFRELDEHVGERHQACRELGIQA